MRTSVPALILLMIMSGCIEGVQENSCGVDADCNSGHVCDAMRSCARADEVRQIEVRWTINGVVPSDTSPGECDGIWDTRAGATDGTSGFSESETCSVGFIRLKRVPWDFITVKAAVYRDLGGGMAELIDLRAAELPNANVSQVVTINLIVP